MYVFFAAYKGKPKSLMGLGLWLIRKVTKSKYSHCEIVNLDDQGRYARVSASVSQGGVFFEESWLNDSNWDFLPVPSDVWHKACELYLTENKAKYDWLGLVRFVIPFLSKQSKKRWFCSEFCATALGLEKPWEYSPASLFLKVSDLYCKGD